MGRAETSHLALARTIERETNEAVERLVAATYDASVEVGWDRETIQHELERALTDAPAMVHEALEDHLA